MKACYVERPLDGNQLFYSGPNGKAIMSVANFDDDIRSHLDREVSYLENLFAQSDYKMFVELGCDQARLLGLASRLQLDYLGVDSRKDLSDYKITPNDAANITTHFLHGCLSAVPDYFSNQRFTTGQKALCVFPFNLLGNLSDPIEVLTSYRKSGFDIAVSNFNCSSEASRIRSAYYSRCSDGHVIQCDTPAGVLFTDFDRFHSLAYRENTLKLLLERAGYKVRSTVEGQTNIFMHCRCDDQSAVVESWQRPLRAAHV